MSEPTQSPLDHSASAAPVLDREVQGKAAASRLVGRNMLALVASQFVTTPVSMVVNAMLARSLGASNFGAIYLATTVLTLAFLFVEWGGYSQVAAAVARDRRSAPRVFGTGLILRIALAALVLAGIPYFGRWMGYDERVQLALALCGFRLAFVSLSNLCSAVVRGFERVDWNAAGTVSGNLMDAALVVVVLLNGGGLRAVLTAQVVAASLALMLQLVFVARLRIGRPTIDRGMLHALVGGGFSFLVLEVVAKLPPYIDATFMERLATPQALGWYSAAARIMGFVIFPANAVGTALYPTLARLWQDDRATCNTMVRLGLRMVTLLGVCAATGTVIFAPFIVNVVYGAQQYAPAAVDLSILSVYVFLVFISIILGSSLAAAGRQWKWALAQSFCLIVSLVLDPLLIPWAEANLANGSAGVCISVVVAEVAMVSSGLALLPAGPLNASLARTLARCLLAAGGMALVGFWLRDWPIPAIPITVAVYAGLLWLQREMDPDLLLLLPPGVANALGFLQRGRDGGASAAS